MDINDAQPRFQYGWMVFCARVQKDQILIFRVLLCQKSTTILRFKTVLRYALVAMEVSSLYFNIDHN